MLQLWLFESDLKVVQGDCAPPSPEGSASPDSPSLLGPQFQGHVLLGPLELTEVLFLPLGHDVVDPDDGLTHNADLEQLGGGDSGDLGNP